MYQLILALGIGFMGFAATHSVFGFLDAARTFDADVKSFIEKSIALIPEGLPQDFRDHFVKYATGMSHRHVLLSFTHRWLVASVCMITFIALITVAVSQG